MINLFTLRDTRSLSTRVLLRAEAEYKNAYVVIGSPPQTSAAAALRDQLGQALKSVRRELRERGLSVGSKHAYSAGS